MTLEAWILIGMIGTLMYLFMSEKLPVDTSALLVLVIGLVVGVINPTDAFSGFASATVITLICSFFITGAIRKTGVGDIVGNYFYKYAGDSETKNVLLVVITGIIISAFINNMSATAMLLPPVIGLSKRSKVPVSKLLIPMTFGVILGGTLTVIGCTANLLANDVLLGINERPFGFLEFTPFGLVVSLFGGIFLAIWGKNMLPVRGAAASSLDTRDLLSLYRLHERLLSLIVPSNSPLIGKSLSEVRLSERFGASIEAIMRNKILMQQPSAAEKICAWDTLVVRGRPLEFDALAKLKGVKVDTVSLNTLDSFFKAGNFSVVEYDIKGRLDPVRTTGALVGGAFSGILPIAIIRDKNSISTLSEEVALNAKDKICCFGTEEALSDFAAELQWSKVQVHQFETQLDNKIHLLTIGDSSPFLGKTLAELDVDTVLPLRMVGIIRGDSYFIKGAFQIPLIQGDQIVTLAQQEKLLPLFDFVGLERGEQLDPNKLYTQKYEIAEAVLSPRSSLIGKTVQEIRFRETYGCHVVAIWRDGTPIRVRLGRTPLRFGDALLLQGPEQRLRALKSDSNFIVAAINGGGTIGKKQANAAILGLLAFVFFAALRLVPVEIAALIGALIVILGKAITMEEAYREVEWRIIVVIAALLPLGKAVEKTGLLNVAAGELVSFGGLYGPSMVLLLLCIFSSFLSQLLDNTLAIVLLVPLSVTAAKGFGLDPHAFAMAVTLASSIVFMFPFSHRANLFVMGAGGYISKDYFKIGTVLSIIMLICILATIPLIYGFSFGQRF